MNRKILDIFNQNILSYQLHFCRPMLMSQGGWSIDIENAWMHLFKILGKKIKSTCKNFKDQLLQFQIRVQ